MQHPVQNIVSQPTKSKKVSDEINKFDKTLADNFKAALLFSQWQRQK